MASTETPTDPTDGPDATASRRPVFPGEIRDAVAAADAVATVETEQTGVRGHGPTMLQVRPVPGVAASALPDVITNRLAALDLPGTAPETGAYEAAGFAWALIHQHPRAQSVARTLAGHPAVTDFRTDWDANHDALAEQPTYSEWPEAGPLFVTVDIDPVTLAAGDCTGESDATVCAGALLQTLREAVVAGTFRGLVGRVEQEAIHDSDAGTLSVTYRVTVAPRAGTARRGSQLVMGDANDRLATATDGSEVQLTVTSPPYIDAIDYDAHARDAGDWSDMAMDEAAAAWYAEQQRIFEAVYEQTCDGGFCAVVIGTIQRDNDSPDRTALPHHFARVMEAAGWRLHETITWNKVTGGSNRFGTTIQHPYPTYYYPNEQHEEIQVWRKGDVQNHRDPASELDMTDLMKQEIANNVWHIPPVPHNGDIDHPCPFPEEIAHRLTLLYSSRGDTVCDPFVGSGTTLLVADRLDRDGVGTELRPSYVARARLRLSNADYERRSQLQPAFESVEPAATAELAHADTTPVREVAVDEGIDPVDNSDDSGADTDQAALSTFK